MESVSVGEYPHQDISFLDFSYLGESNLYLDGIYSSHIHSDDVKYIRELSCKIDCSQIEFRKPKTTPRKSTSETLDVRVVYMDNEPLIEICNINMTLKELIVCGLRYWEPRELSCSWIGNQPEDYILKLKKTGEYMRDNSRRLLEMDLINENDDILELELVERNRVEFEVSGTKSGFDKDIIKTMTKRCIPSFAVEDELVICCSGLGDITQQHLKDFAVYASYRDITFEIEFELRHDGRLLTAHKPSLQIEYNKINKKLNELIFFPIKIRDIPRESFIRAYINAVRRTPAGFRGFMQNLLFLESSTPSQIGWADYSLYNFQSFLNEFASRTNIRSGQPQNFYLACSEVEGGAYLTMCIQNSSEESIVFALESQHDGDREDLKRSKRRERDWEKIRNDKAPDTLLWKYRYDIPKKLPGKLVSLLKSVDWCDKEYVSEIHRIVKDFPVIHSFAGLEILALPIADLNIKEYAVKCLWGLSDSEIISIIPQLVQSIKKEMYICGPISRFLLTKALNRKSIGYVLYWHIKSEMDEEVMFSRFRVLKQCYLENIEASYRREILSIERIFEDLIRVARLAQSDCLTPEQFRTRLWEIKFPHTGCCLPSSKEDKILGLCVEECAVLNSKTKPLWLSFEGTDGGSKIYAILKIGDDIRVDGLALQMMEILDGLWKSEGLDLHLQPYVTLPLKQKVGLIRVSNKAETTATINWKHGGNSFTSAFSSTSLKAFLYKNNSVLDREIAFKNFALSCAGYCVFTYVFGVGDRHGDNIMCTKEGNIFHIDFGYFLGEKSRFLGFSRESGYFVLTPNYINAMDKFFDLFIDRACSGFVIAQRYEKMFSTLIELMTPCGPEVLTEDQISYVRKALEPWVGEREGKRKFYNIILRSLQDKRSLLNDFAHLVATRNGK